jgi:hypothetical protein
MGMVMSFKSLKKRIRGALARREIQQRDPKKLRKPHGLDREVIVSLTSYPARYKTLSWTIRSLLQQSVAADHTILWVTDSDFSELPPDVLELRSQGLEIRTYPVNYKSYLKIIPALELFPTSYIVTADDDLPYWETWLEELSEEMRRTQSTSICHRAHRVTLDPNLMPLDYGDWEMAISLPASGALVFPTGVHGVMYDATKLHPKTTDSDEFLSLAPSADDIWLYWMVRLTQGVAVKIGKKRRVIEWHRSQVQNLRRVNIQGGGNNVALRKMIERFGFKV